MVVKGDGTLMSTETARLRRHVERLRAERDLASGKGFYLRLDASRYRLVLMLEGVALDDYAASAVEWGVPEVLFVNRHPGADWDATAFSKGRLEVSTTSPDLGEASDSLPVEYDGEEVRIGFNGKYLLDALGGIDGEKLSVEMRDGQGQALFRPESGEGFTAIVMPMRLT